MRDDDRDENLPGEGTNAYVNLPERVEDFETMPSVETMLGLKKPPVLKAAGVAIRRGEIDPAGAYFSLPGQSTYFDEDMVGVDPDIYKYDVSAVNLADTSKSGVAVSILNETLKDPALTDEDKNKLGVLLSEAEQGEPFISYMDNDSLPIPEAAKRLGYDGIIVWENDDIANPSSAFIWNLGKVRKTATPAAVALPISFEQFCKKHGGFLKLFNEIADPSSDWERYGMFYDKDEQEEFDALPSSEQDKVLERRAYEEWEDRYNQMRWEHSTGLGR